MQSKAIILTAIRVSRESISKLSTLKKCMILEHYCASQRTVLMPKLGFVCSISIRLCTCTYFFLSLFLCSESPNTSMLMKLLSRQKSLSTRSDQAKESLTYLNYIRFLCRKWEEAGPLDLICYRTSSLNAEHACGAVC